jgi:hypothetical protein
MRSRQKANRENMAGIEKREEGKRGLGLWERNFNKNVLGMDIGKSEDIHPIILSCQLSLISNTTP